MLCGALFFFGENFKNSEFSAHTKTKQNNKIIPYIWSCCQFNVWTYWIEQLPDFSLAFCTIFGHSCFSQRLETNHSCCSASAAVGRLCSSIVSKSSIKLRIAGDHLPPRGKVGLFCSISCSNLRNGVRGGKGVTFAKRSVIMPKAHKSVALAY